MTTEEKLNLITRYYAACSSGDVEALADTLAETVTHYFLAPNPGSAPVSGAQHLARYWRKVQGRVAGRWVVDHIVGEADEAVIEWTLYWNTDAGERVATRGAEWYRFDGAHISEIRAYYQQRAATTELQDFAYASRGYSRLGHEMGYAHPLSSKESHGSSAR